MIEINKIREAIKQKDITNINKLFENEREADIAELLENLDTYEMVFLLRIMETEMAAEVFSYLEPDLQEEVIKGFSSQETKELIESLYSDDIVDVLDEMPANIQKKILKMIPKERRELINGLLMYDDDLAGSIMSVEFLELKETDTCLEALMKIKKQANRVEYVDYIYVIDKSHKLVGGLDIKDIITNKDETLIIDIMDSNQGSIFANESLEQALDMIRKYDYSSLPVLNHENRLIGVITFDDIIDAIDEETTEDIHKMGAISPIEESYKKISVFKMYKKTIGWLLILMFTATLTQSVMSGYEDVLAATSLALFIPLLMDTGGNAGGQSSTIVIRALVLNEITTKDFWLVIRKELATSLMLGVTLAVVNLARMALMPGFNKLGSGVVIVVSFTIIFTITIAKTIGGILPLIAKLFKQDPAVMAGPLITTIVDVFTLIVYFNLAKLIMHIS